MTLSLPLGRSLVRWMDETDVSDMPVQRIGLSQMVPLEKVLPPLKRSRVKVQDVTDSELDAVRVKLEQAASVETAFDADTYLQVCKTRPLAQHCKAASWVVQQLFGGRIVYAKMPTGVAHYWNILPCGREVDVTAPQYEGVYEGNGRDPVVPFTHITLSGKSVNPRFKKLYKRYQEKAAQ